MEYLIVVNTIMLVPIYFVLWEINSKLLALYNVQLQHSNKIGQLEGKVDGKL